MTAALVAGLGATAVPAAAQIPTLPDLDRKELRGRVGPLAVPRILPSPEELRDVEIDPELRRLVDQLDDPSFDRREEATLQLLSEPLDVRDLCSLLEEPELSAERRYRLLDVLRWQLRSRPRGALGIQMMWRQNTPNEPGAVEIVRLLPGLPAEQVLLPGDKITHVDGHELFYQDDLIVIVQSKKPGEAVRLNLLRQRRDTEGNLVTVDGRVAYDPVATELGLGSAEKLRDPETGIITPAGAVDEERVKEALIASWRYAPQAHAVEVITGRDADLLARQTREGTVDAEVESHPEIQALRMERSLIDRGQLRLNIERRRRWQLRLEDVLRRAEDPTATVEERRLLERVGERMEELIRP
ncbi:MAG: PDZ domain-containing protein [Planctomycetes bacterium]|nr:PDZ domain-containing protein [Planctomycetota bacterium]